MTSDRVRFRELIGVMPGARLSLLRSLLNGPSSLADLVRDSALPRRDVEDFLASLGGLERDERAQRYLLTADSRDHYQRLFDEFSQSRPLLTAADDDDLQRLAGRLIAGAPAPRKRFDQVQATPGTAVRRVRWLTENFDLGSRSVLFVGDHDLTSLLLAHVVTDARLTVVDIDEHVLAYIENSARAASPPAPIDCVFADLRFGLPPALAESADVVFTDPPYTPEGLALFLTRALAGLNRRSPDNRIVIAFGHSRRRPDLGLAAQREILRAELVIDCMLPSFSRYVGAQAVGSASDLYSCQPTPRAFRRLDLQAPTDAQRGIYTQGEHSVESLAHSAADVVQLLPQVVQPGPVNPRNVGLVAVDPGPAREFGVAVGLGKLLGSGVHPSVTGRVGEFVVDLRDDPGPWLMRSLLALNADTTTCLLREPHEALDDLNADSAAWDLVGAKFSSVSARELPGKGLVAVRCELAGPGPAGPELELARFVLRRAHGRLRNVWREGLIEIAKRAGKTLTRREALALIEAQIGHCGHDLPFRLMDVPAYHFAGLRQAIGSSAAGLTRD
jgi:Branched-chain polyamine synthase A C-terminal domain